MKASVTKKAQGILAKQNANSRAPDGEERLDAEDLDCLSQMMALGSQYIEEQDEPDDQPNIPKMQAILESIAGLVPVEVNEDEPEDEPEDEEVSAEPDGEVREVTEPEPSEATTREEGEPEPPVATTRKTFAGQLPPRSKPSYQLTRKEPPKWHLK